MTETKATALSDDWRDKPHVHGGTDCGGGSECPAREPALDATRRRPARPCAPIEWTAGQHYARGVADGLGQAFVYLLQYGPEEMGAWLTRRERGFMALLPTDANGNTQFQPDTTSEARA